MLLIQIFLIVSVLISAQDNHDNGKNENVPGEIDKNKNVEDNKNDENVSNGDEDDNKDVETLTTPVS